jgi:hypothetical protein
MMKKLANKKLLTESVAQNYSKLPIMLVKVPIIDNPRRQETLIAKRVPTTLLFRGSLHSFFFILSDGPIKMACCKF